MFALSALGRAPLEVSVKCEPELALQLRRTYAAIRPSYHLNKRHWNTVTLDGSLPPTSSSAISSRTPTTSW
jgi:predicted DNA-binding protein (MmcQ/YjbR family)